MDRDRETRKQDGDSVSGIARDWVIRLASGRMTAEELSCFKAWLAESPGHRQAFERERTFWQQLDALEGAMRAESGNQPAWNTTPPDRSHHYRPLLIGGAIAACLALAVFSQDILVLMLADHRTPVGQQQRVTLPDGGIAYLNTDTAIVVTYTAEERRVRLLRGEAFFQVVHDRNKPFRVHSEDGVTQAVGTAFAVHAQERQTSVTVTEGTVAVSTRHHPSSLPVTVQAEQRTVYRIGESPQPVESVDAGSATAWIREMIVIENRSFAEAMAELNRYRPGRIVVLADLSHTKPVSGQFTILGIDDALAALAGTQGLTILHVTPYLVFIL